MNSNDYWPEGYKPFFFKLNSAEHEIFSVD